MTAALNRTLTIGELRNNLARIDRRHDGEIIAVWLPGSRIDLGGGIFRAPRSGPFPSGFVIEGNVREGSALGEEIT
jgi:hypothetical protein